MAIEVLLRGVRGGTIVARLRPQVEALRRLRNEGSQIVRVEHVHVNEGGQVVTGNVKSSGSERAGRCECGRGIRTDTSQPRVTHPSRPRAAQPSIS